MDGQPATADIAGTDPVKVRWNFGPLENETHTFVLEYKVDGVVRKQPESDAVIWRALPPQRGYRIDTSDVKLIYPEGIRLLNAGVSGKHSGIFFAPYSATAKMSRLDSEARVVFRAEFPRDAFAVAMPRWQAARHDRRRSRRPCGW